jgi:cytoskeletal protein RodZ
MKKAILAVLLASALWFEACTVPAWVNTAEQDAEVAAPIAASLIDIIDPSLAPVVTLVENGFNALVKTLDTYKASPTATNLQAVESAFAAVNANVAQLESAAQIKNATTATTVSAVVQLLAQAVTEIAALVPAETAKTAVSIPNSGSRIPDSETQAQASSSRIPDSEAKTQASGLGTSIVPSHTAKGWKAEDFKREYNRIAQQDPRLKPLE